MTDEAIRKDVSEQESGFDTSRAEAMKRISDRQKQEREEDEGIVAVSEEPEDLEEDLDLDDNDEALESDEGDGEPESPVFMKDGKWMTREKVNGEEREVEFDRVLATAQKHEAADLRLDQASRRLQEIEQREQAIAERERLSSQQNQLPAQGVDNSEEVKDLIRQKREALIDGDDEAYEAAELKLFELQGRQSATPQITQEDVVSLTRRELAAKEQAQIKRDVEAANISFAKANSDIVNDPVLFNATNKFSADLLVSNPEYTPEENLAAAAKRTREWLADKSKAQFSDERQDRKRRSTTPSGVNARSKVGKDAPKPKTRSETIAEMRKSRGQNY